MLFLKILLFILETVQFSTRIVFLVINFMLVSELFEGGGDVFPAAWLLQFSICDVHISSFDMPLICLIPSASLGAPQGSDETVDSS